MVSSPATGPRCSNVRADGDMSQFMRRLIVPHTQRWNFHHQTAPPRPRYQRRFRPFFLQSDGSLLVVNRRLGPNALVADLIRPVRERCCVPASGGTRRKPGKCA